MVNMKTVDFNEFLEELEDVLAHPRPWAHIRFGDGEGIVMGYPEYTKVERCKARWHKWLGDNEIVTAPGYMTAFSELIRASVEIADIVGTPCLRHQYVNQDWRNVIKYMEDLGLVNEDTRSCCMDHTVDLQRKGLYRKLLQDKEIIYISCRKVTNELMAIGAKNVMGIFLPPQNKPFMGDVHTKKKHYTEIYNAIKGYIFEFNTGGIDVTVGIKETIDFNIVIIFDIVKIKNSAYR